MVGFYATEDEAGAMMQAASDAGMTLADWLRSLIPEKEPKQKPTRRSAAKGS